jgi:hypothetical protein
MLYAFLTSPIHATCPTHPTLDAINKTLRELLTPSPFVQALVNAVSVSGMKFPE